MPRPSRRAEIIEVAAALFAEHGLNGVSLKDVAERAGIRVTSIYRIFRDKAELYDAVLGAVLARAGMLGRALFALDAEPAEVVKAVVYRSVRNSLLGAADRKLFFRALADEDAVAIGKITALRREGIDSFIEVIARVCGDRDPHAIYFAITSLTTGFMHFRPFFDQIRPLKDEERDPDQVTEAVLRMALPEIDWASVRLLATAAAAEA